MTGKYDGRLRGGKRITHFDNQALVRGPRAIRTSQERKTTRGRITRLNVTLKACRRELEEMATLASNYAICRSIVQAAELHAPLIAEAVAQEEQAARDREFALRLSGNHCATPTAASRQINKAKQPAKDIEHPLDK